jgi:hypothetical protein
MLLKRQRDSTAPASLAAALAPPTLSLFLSFAGGLLALFLSLEQVTSAATVGAVRGAAAWPFGGGVTAGGATSASLSPDISAQSAHVQAVLKQALLKLY